MVRPVALHNDQISKGRNIRRRRGEVEENSSGSGDNVWVSVEEDQNGAVAVGGRTL